MSKYTVTSMTHTVPDTWETVYSTPCHGGMVVKQTRPGAGLEEMWERAETKCRKLNREYGPGKIDARTFAYRTINNTGL